MPAMKVRSEEVPTAKEVPTVKVLTIVGQGGAAHGDKLTFDVLKALSPNLKLMPFPWTGTCEPPHAKLHCQEVRGAADAGDLPLYRWRFDYGSRSPHNGWTYGYSHSGRGPYPPPSP